jgi:phospholipid/cholesterol/gamma-HCH transport system substrate-binding protein
MLERNQFVVGLVVIVLVAIGTAFAVGATAGLFVEGEPMTASFTDAAGLESDDFVFVGGHRAGTVTDVEIDGDQVEVSFTLTVEEMPEDSMAEITLSSALGRRGLTIVPGTASSHLEAGSHIPLARTSTPVDLPEFGDRSAELLDELDVDAFRELTTALADVTEGNREEVQELLEGLEAVTTIVSDRREEIEAVLDRATVVIDATASKDAELIRIIDDFGFVLNRLVDRRDDISRLLRETATTSTLTADLVAERRDQIDRVLASFSQDLAIIDRHQVDLAHTLPYLGAGLEGFAGIGYSGGDARTDNPRWGNVFTTGLGQIGVGALLDCGGAIDVLFTDLLGPDPRCDGQGVETQGPEESPPVEDDGSGGDPTLPLPSPGASTSNDLGERVSDGEALRSFLDAPSSLAGGDR